MQQNNRFFTDIADSKYISLTTYYKSGKGVSTPVEFVLKEDKIYVNTRKDSYKVKRIKNSSKAKIAPCTMRGKIKGQEIEVLVRILPDSENSDAVEAFQEKYSGFFFKVMTTLFFWRKQHERIYIEIIPAGNGN